MKNLLSVCLFFLCSPLLRAQYFELGTNQLDILATEISTMDVETADFNGDELPDIVLAGEVVRNVILFNDGQGNFLEDPERLFPKKEPESDFAGQDSEDIAIADFDNDNDLDILFVSEDTQFHELLINDGTGTFTFADFDFPASQGNAVAILDLNGDEWPDIIIGNTGQNQVFINNQDLTFTLDESRWPENTEGTQDLKLMDVDGDGDMDIVEGIDLGMNNLLINENGTFVEENNRLPFVNLNLEIRKVALGDVNGDDNDDIFICTVNFTGPSSLQNRLYINNGDGTFSDETLSRFPLYAEQSLDAVFIDFDLDDDLDLVTGGFNAPGNNYRAFENDGTGVFNEITETVFPDNFNMNDCIAIDIADLNGDGFPDLYFGGFGETDDLLFFNPAAVSVVDMETNEAIIYPNPSNDRVKVDCNYPNIDSLLITDVQGKKVERTFRLQSDGISFSIQDLSDGVYTVRLFENGSLRCQGRFVKGK